MVPLNPVNAVFDDDNGLSDHVSEESDKQDDDNVFDSEENVEEDQPENVQDNHHEEDVALEPVVRPHEVAEDKDQDQDQVTIEK